MSERKTRSDEVVSHKQFAGIQAGEVVRLQIEELDLEDKTFMFRAVVRVADLRRSLGEEGQQIPIIVRRTPRKEKYQIISGFRRTQAAIRLGWKEIAAIVRSGLSNEEAFRAAVLENTARKTYSDIDRAYVIQAYRQRRYGGEEVAKTMGLTDRQVRNLLSLLELPDEVQGAIEDREQHFSATHALTLRKLQGTCPMLDYNQWVAVVNEEKLSVSQLRRKVTKEHKPEVNTGFETVFQAKGTDWTKGEIRFAPVKVTIREMSEAEKSTLKAELERLLEKLD